ncbi:MAG: prolyl oligopeptidase family serine peptidase [Candidatus Chromulinivorax sp.]|nr:prolyl oligopeptidase family serine peptidase [Candidatus Chromulinivorax sp.]
MKKNFILAILISCCLFSTVFLTQKEIEPAIDFYDTTFLRNSPAVEKVLKNNGFFEVDFKTHDNLMINAIMLDQSNELKVTATIISCPGFVPGRKEGMSTLYAMLKNQPYNFIFVDSRGHGKSDGELLTFNGIKHYGENQYLDMIATIKFIANYNKQRNINQNIIIHGLCAGAFHTVKAVADLKQSDPETYKCIKGIIVDSGWPAITDMIDPLLEAEATERCKSYGVPSLQPYLAYILHGVYDTFFKPSHCKQIPLNMAISKIDQPILFIHAENDLFVPIHNVYPLIDAAKNPTTWFLKESAHVNNHLKHKEAYTHQMQRFIQTALE